MKRPNKPADSQSKLDRRKTTTTRRGPNEDLDRQRRANTNDRDEVRQHTTHRQGHPK